MNVALDERSESLVAGLVRDGRFESPTEVVKEGLRLVEEQEAKLSALRAMLQRSIDEGGEATEEDIDEALAERSRELTRQGF